MRLCPACRLERAVNPEHRLRVFRGDKNLGAFNVERTVRNILKRDGHPEEFTVRSETRDRTADGGYRVTDQVNGEVWLAEYVERGEP